MSRDLTIVTSAQVLGTTAHTTYMYYLAPIALRHGEIVGLDAAVFATTAIAMGLTVLPAGRLADRIPRRYVMRVGLLLLALAYLALLPVPRFGFLLAGSALSGVGLGFLTVSFQSYVADLLLADERGAAYGRAGALSILASAAGPALAALLFRMLSNDALGLRLNAVLFGIAALIGIWLTTQLPSVRGLVYAPAERGRWHEAARAALPVAAVYLFMGAGYGMTAPYFTVFFLDHVHLEKSTWGYLLALGTVVSAGGSWVAGRLARAGPTIRISLAGQALLLASSLLFLFPLGPMLLAVGFLGRSLFSTTSGPVMNAIAMSRAGPARRAETTAWTSIAWNVGWTCGAASGATLLARVGGGLFPLGGALAITGVLAGALLLRRR